VVFFSDMSGDHANENALDTEMKVHSLDNESLGGTDENAGENLVFDEAKTSRALALWVCTDDLPLQIIEEPCFLHFVHTLNPFAKPGNLKMVKAECLKIFKEERVKIKQALADFDGQISLSVDVLKTPACNEYMCLTAHFIDDGWEVKKWVLSFCRVWEVDEDVSKMLLKCISDWNIENKISTITMKNNSDYDALVKILKHRVQEKKKLQLNGQLFRVYCCADILCSIVMDALDEIQEIIGEVLDLVACGRQTPFWHLTYHALKEVSELNSMGEFFKDEYHGVEIPPNDVWNKVGGVVKLIGSVHNVAKSLFETKYATTNNYLHNLQDLRASLIPESMSSDSFIKPIAEKMLQKFDKYWNDMFLLLALTTLLDPRFKKKYFEFSSLKYEDSDGKLQVTAVLDAIQTLYDEYATTIDESEKSMSKSSAYFEGEDGDGPCPKSRRVEEGCDSSKDGFDWVQEYNQFTQSKGRCPKSELDFYLEDPVIPWIEDFDLISWWRASSSKYPTLARVARDLLAIPISVVTSYDAYLTTAREVDLGLLSSGRDIMGALMCTRSWKQSDSDKD
jgi:hypothetical protein